ncbi:1-hydroxycarotenoid 3,4-desaturase CrtD [Nereida sp. MMG025]|uniref:1-hydroxycarotenoid 3,4-desaturase CrtD n=1 Tax=Nereida sp. MMG025 TaxID=2909981 RepID=UPI00351CEE5C|nr:phytoene desaturase family protein [Nereida sp. MMG025]
METSQRIICAQDPTLTVIGAGIGGLCAAIRLAHAGVRVTVLERASDVGGKMRTLPSAAGPVDAGPTVMTMAPVFERLFADVGETLSDHITLEPLSTLARHYWHDGGHLDLMADPEATAANIRDWGGAQAEADYRRFAANARALFEAFDAPMMGTPEPSQMALTLQVLRAPHLIPKMAPWFTLAQSLHRQFRDKRLAQLFGRYATYVGGSPYQSPALLGLISHSEARGVWSVKGGMRQLAQALKSLAVAKGVIFQFDTAVTRIEIQSGTIRGVIAKDGRRFATDQVLFNGDPKALQDGVLGQTARQAVPQTAVQTRSLSAHVHAFAAEPKGPELAHHTVFFGRDSRTEFDPIAQGQMPRDPSLYICAQDHPRDGLQRFEIIMNGPATTAGHTTEREIEQCQTLVFETLAQFGLTFSPRPTPQTLTTPAMFGQLFPASNGSLYGQSPHGLTASLKRPTARTGLTGLYLTGGGTHPGAGIPMAALSGQHAAAAIMTDLALTSTSPKTAMHGGMSTASAPAAPAPSASSVS